MELEDTLSTLAVARGCLRALPSRSRMLPAPWPSPVPPDVEAVPPGVPFVRTSSHRPGHGDRPDRRPRAPRVWCCRCRIERVGPAGRHRRDPGLHQVPQRLVVQRRRLLCPPPGHRRHRDQPVRLRPGPTRTRPAPPGPTRTGSTPRRSCATSSTILTAPAVVALEPHHPSVGAIARVGRLRGSALGQVKRLTYVEDAATFTGCCSPERAPALPAGNAVAGPALRCCAGGPPEPSGPGSGGTTMQMEEPCTTLSR
ncbi:hypothetical protein FHU40_003534 [Nocardioides soli]|uniref:Uncharacterized protein n=1 Tax=Nocardioides soli TaxID=1036020 RepID=A0A7W4VXQ9_9ACTN|nr:hypothetical protein [Nocardioides soli]